MAEMTGEETIAETAGPLDALATPRCLRCGGPFPTAERPMPALCPRCRRVALPVHPGWWDGGGREGLWLERRAGVTPPEGPPVTVSDGATSAGGETGAEA